MTNVDQRKYLHKQINIQWEGVEPQNLNIEPERPRALRKMAEMLYGKKDGSISYQKLAKETPMPVSLVGEILDVHAPQQVTRLRAVAEVRQFLQRTETTDNELEQAM